MLLLEQGCPESQWTRTKVTGIHTCSCGTLEAVSKTDKIDYIDWDAGREGYLQSKSKYVPVVDIQKSNKKVGTKNHLFTIRGEERFGSLLAAAGIIWAVYVATVDYNNLWRMQIMPPGPIEVCAVGILAWLHAKWRRSTKVD